MAWRIGVDIGGTFTDVAVLDETSGRVGIAKVSTTPHDFGAAVIDGTRTAMDEYRIAPDAVSLLAHATTIVTNALLEAKGANVALVATRGFRDVLEIRRSARADLYDLFQDAPAVLVPRRWRLEIDERIDAQGEIVTALDEAEIDTLVDSIRSFGEVQAVAVCLMFSFLNDVHERRIGERLRAALPGVPVFLSSEILPEIREFERTSTTAVCAYVGPVFASYLERLAVALTELDLPALHVMGSSGGVLDVAEALRMPAAAVESGPAAGVIAAQRLGDQLGRANLISFDMGGTTAKASLIENGRIETTSEYEVGGQGNVGRWLHGTGHPIRVPVIDLAEVSAGGGSIAWLDPGGALRVGPASAGAEPGPACYARGGDRPTVTDANVVLGRLHKDYFLGGEMRLDEDAAARVLGTLSESLGLSPTEAAEGVLTIVTSNMANAIRSRTVQKGIDPREYALVAFGGAGPLHAVDVATELGAEEVIVPPYPGITSAMGLLTTDLKYDTIRTEFQVSGEVDLARLNADLAAMEAELTRQFHDDGIDASDVGFVRGGDLRYVGQGYELRVDFPPGELSTAALSSIFDRFHAQHEAEYGHVFAESAIEIVNLRVSGVGSMPKIARPRPRTGSSLAAARVDTGRCLFRTASGLESLATPFYARERLPIRERLAGPAIIVQQDSTTVVPPGAQAMAHEHGHLVVRVGNRIGENP